MKNNNSGLSLTELLVSSIIIGIVMLGVVSFNYTVGRIEKTTSRSTVVKSRVAAALLHLKKDVEAAVGDANDWGIHVYEKDGPSPDFRNSLCVRHDADNDPSSYAGDQWKCYYHGESFGLARRDWTAGDVPAQLPCETNDKCNGKDQFGVEFPYNKIITLASVDAGGAKVGDHSVYAKIVPGPNADNMDYVLLTVTTRFDAHAPADPIDNPEYTLTTKAYPRGHSQ